MIRIAKPEDLPRLEACAREFYATSRFLGAFDISRFCETWRLLMGGNQSVIFVDEREGEIAGTLGGYVHVELYGHENVAEEMFWFVREEFRGVGLRLYRAFEDWARMMHAHVIQMVHLLDVNPEKVSAFYERIGYEPIETRYQKRLA